jgi:hypothetical protein
VGTRVARALWLLLWASLAYFALQPAVRAPRAISDTISGMAAGQPGWLAALGHHGGVLLAGHGLLVSVLLATAFAVIAVGSYLPASWSRGIFAAAVALAAIIWLAQGLGGIMTGMGTDPGSAPLLALLVFAYWPRSASATGPARVATPAPAMAGVGGGTGSEPAAVGGLVRVASFGWAASVGGGAGAATGVAGFAGGIGISLGGDGAAT